MRRAKTKKTMGTKNLLDRLKEQYIAAQSEAEREGIFNDIRRLIEEDAQAVAQAAAEQSREIVEEAEALAIRKALGDILPAISVAYIARVYFGKSRSWLTQRINGSLVNGKPAAFTSEERETMRQALRDLSNKLAACNI